MLTHGRARQLSLLSLLSLLTVSGLRPSVLRTPLALLLGTDATSGVSRRALLVTSGAAAGCTLLGAPHGAAALADLEDQSGDTTPAALPAAVAEGASPPPPVPPPLPSAFDFDVPFRGEPSAIKPFLGRASILVNVKFDDPETLEALPGLKKLLSGFAKDGLHVLAFPTDQGWFCLLYTSPSPRDS